MSAYCAYVSTPSVCVRGWKNTILIPKVDVDDPPRTHGTFVIINLQETLLLNTHGPLDRWSKNLLRVLFAEMLVHIRLVVGHAQPHLEHLRPAKALVADAPLFFCHST